MAREKQRPGVVIYFDDFRPVLNRLTNDQIGLLLRGLLSYAEYGEMPDALDPVSSMVFDMLRPRIDADGERYEAMREQRRYAVFCRERERNNLPSVDIDSWRSGEFS